MWQQHPSVHTGSGRGMIDISISSAAVRLIDVPEAEDAGGAQGLWRNILSDCTLPLSSNQRIINNVYLKGLP